jgi:hypothetical protein
MGARIERAKRAPYVTRVARRSGLFRVLREIGVVGERAPTAEGARELPERSLGLYMLWRIIRTPGEL